ncbi:MULTISPECIES: DNA-processing protein DprA [Flavobacterium]|uniref:DNA-protecting protein DprA n=2 Tax=Flavobacterium TaxID=237 RepID=A0AA94F385_9FLAO|nr:MULTISPECIES: DNA-processing protein DprA [Flavobacterium]OXA83234.1 DNA-processing protein DprA [Flavobacterium columnare NBRC 100251 = ATCC 23463]AMA47955.1 DNA processing protein DprA [Flavobacterium covae]AND63902.1 DNA processing protein DprA [Flavobacterium covae]MCH4829854.1 DNA-protecting protein DprA [Flavobacterium columnare]MCH4832767.1 DNA-protecting protein DprA [Flavobacterium columnare]
MLHTDLFYALALLNTEGVGDVIAKRLILSCGSAEEVFKTNPTQLAKIDGVGGFLIQNLKKTNLFTKAEKELSFLLKESINVWYFQDSLYPTRLKECYDAPILLFTTGNIHLENPKIISIVGTRQVTRQGIDFCENLIQDLAPLNPVIISGFAYGVDIVAHQCAMKYGLQTIGVLAHGLNQIYPKSHKKYMRKMEENGGFITEFWSTSNPDRENFVRRNRIVAGISEATIVIESAEQGGSLLTAQMANNYHRDVFAVPGRVTDKYSKGCNNLIKTNNAQLLTNATDLIYHLNWDLKKSIKSIQKQLFVSLETEEQIVYDFLKTKGKEHLDYIALQCELPIYKLSSIFLNMELKGVIRPLPGKYFEIV